MKPSDYDPQKALLVRDPPTGPRWIHELKLDGFRMAAVVTSRGTARTARLISRRGTEYTAEYPEIVAAVLKLSATTAVLDGEVVVLDEKGLTNFQRLQNLGASRRGLAYFA